MISLTRVELVPFGLLLAGCQKERVMLRKEPGFSGGGPALGARLLWPIHSSMGEESGRVCDSGHVRQRLVARG
jgi:hypothetical protein